MFFLSFDIVHYLVFVVDAVGEGCILVSPPIEIGEGGIGLDPLAGKSLDSLHILRHRYGGWERNKDMHMVGHTTNAICLSMQVIGLFHDDRIELAVVLDGDGLLATIGAKDYVIERLDITHIDKTQGSDNYCIGFESASLRDAGWMVCDNPTLRCACAGLLKACAFGTFRWNDQYMTTEARYAHRGASKRLTLNNPAQARQGAVWGCTPCLPIGGVPEARALKNEDGNESASLRDAGWMVCDNPTLRCACVGLLKTCAFGTFLTMIRPME